MVDSPRCVTKCVNASVSIVSNADNAFWEAVFVLSSIIRDKKQQYSGRGAHFVVLRPTTHDGRPGGGEVDHSRVLRLYPVVNTAT